MASIAISAASASGAAPPNMPEWSSDAIASTVTTTLTMPAQAHGRGGVAHGGVAGVADQDRVGTQQVGVAGDERLEAAGALFLRPLDHQLQVHRHVVAERPQCEQVHEDVALAVGGAPAVPAAVDLGELEGRRAPRGVVEGRLHVVVRVQQHGRARPDRRPAASRRPRRCRPACARGAHRRIRARRTCRAPTAPPWCTPRAGTAAGPPRTGWPRTRRARPAPAHQLA